MENGMKTMTKSMLLVMMLSFASINTLSAQTLTVKVHNINPISGNLMVGVFNREAGFPDVYFKGKKVQITHNVMVVTFTDLPKGKYAVSVYQDINKNEQLDKNIFGVPKEKYGFSNKTNKPDYKESLFDFNKDLILNITLK
jgi:uncharacterized protein (DUF2141 family)